MATRTYKRLTVARVRELAKAPGMHPDGDGVYLSVTKTGVAIWAFRNMLDWREHAMGRPVLRALSLCTCCPASAPMRQKGQVEEGRISGPS